MSLRAKLEVLFRRCCRLALCDNGPLPLISNQSVYSLLGVIPLRHLFQYTSAIMLYKILVLKQVPALYPKFAQISGTCRNSRLSLENVIVLRPPFVTLEMCKANFSYWGSTLWNSIPGLIRRSNSLSTFSRLYLEYLTSRIRDFSSDRYDLLDFL